MLDRIPQIPSAKWFVKH